MNQTPKPIDPNNFLSYAVWLDLPMDTRWKIANLFNVSPRTVREVVDSRVVSDGFVHADLRVITREKMQEITGKKTDDFYVLFQALVDHVTEKGAPEVEVEAPIEPESTPVESTITLNADEKENEITESASKAKPGRKGSTKAAGGEGTEEA